MISSELRPITSKRENHSETSMKAECQCGQLSVALPGPSAAVVACHCIDCQRRSGSPFGVLAYYPADQLVIAGEAKRFERPTATGGVFASFFCPACGSTVYAKAAKHPTLIGVAVGAIADPGFPAPVRSVWEQSMHPWAALAGDIQHFPQGRS
jgi:hypothetical protein